MDPSEDHPKKHVKVKHIKSYNGLKLEKYNDVLRLIKSDDKVVEFTEKVTKMLNMISDEDKKYDEDVVKFVLECVEMCFMKRKSGELKLKVATNILLPHFKNDEMLVQKFIKLILPVIRKSNMFRRNYSKLRRFFCLVYDTLPFQ